MSCLKWFRLPSRVALLLGLGALSAAGARAEAGQDVQGASADPVAQNQRTAVGDLLLWSEGGRLYVAEGSGPAEELRLGDTEEARHLRQLLQQHGGQSAGVRLDRMILAGGGGKGISGSHWKPVGSGGAANRTKTGAAERTMAPKAIDASRKAGPAGGTKSAGTEDNK